ncbi:TIGR04255 family protein [Leptolyngbya sp. PCC 6406]|uniref:TIGR04255 family protein n=1 Tax=Leptolyngbya sp. PCC 6406 TaxID=1173264 RepID=UPI0002AC460D|nr:TIGR04255 family protein [Leptolyngbya sp. PCC 6406]
MSPLPKFSIDFSEEFPSLQAPPSIEAVIHWQTHAGKKLEPEALKAELIQRLPDYPNLQTQHDVQIGATGAPDGSSEIFHRAQWSGFRLQDEQNRHVAQFTLNGVTFSRLEPYEEWATFQTEALRFWNIFLELAAPTIIQRLGVRYINRIPLAVGEQPSKYLSTVPTPPPGLDLATESFFHQDTYPVPGYPYSINWVRTIQPTGADPADGRALIVDIDVFTHELLQLDQDTLAQRLQEMRWLKNKVFFNCMTPHALERFGATP